MTSSRRGAASTHGARTARSIRATEDAATRHLDPPPPVRRDRRPPSAMRARLVAAGIGVLITVIASLVFLETRHPQVAGTNSVAPYTPAWSIPAESARCQLLRKVPGGANRIRMALSSAPETGPIQAAVVRHGTVIAQAQIRPIVGNVQFKLGRQTPAINRARLCITNLGKQRAVFLGEHKKTRRHPGAVMRR